MVDSYPVALDGLDKPTALKVMILEALSLMVCSEFLLVRQHVELLFRSSTDLNSGLEDGRLVLELFQTLL